MIDLPSVEFVFCASLTQMFWLSSNSDLEIDFYVANGESDPSCGETKTSAHAAANSLHDLVIKFLCTKYEKEIACHFDIGEQKNISYGELFLVKHQLQIIIPD